MGYPDMIIAALSVVIVLAYAFHILLFTYGWMRLRMDPAAKSPASETMVSVVVAMRDEKDNIHPLIRDLKAQDYPHELFEVILVDDHSADGTAELVESLLGEAGFGNIRSISLERSGLPGSKKRAIEAGIAAAKGELVAVTDADCRLETSWLSTIVGIFDRRGLKMICGPVQLTPGKGMAARFRELEFLSLVGSGAGSVGAGRPVFCNGANMAFERKAFDEVRGYAGNEKYASGDDVFLLHKIRKQYGSGGIGFAIDRDSIVRTAGTGSWGSFFRQRIRWASKAKGYKDLLSLSTALSVYLLNLTLLGFFIAGFFNPFYFFLAGYLFILKLMLDFPLLFGTTLFFQRQTLLSWFLPFEVIYVFYVVMAGFVSLFYGGVWKGRRVGR
jgi:cellulose synthase/poly-beta-1,6-N-acetylglucosamine synthase-like glycosyltransferase